MKFFRPPRVSQMPSSGWSQFSHSQSIMFDIAVQPSWAICRPWLSARDIPPRGLTVDVELQLIGRAIADPHRSRPAPALEVIQGLLDEIRAAVHPVHDLQRAGPATGLLLRPVPEPGAEGGGLLHVAQAQQRVDGEGAVPDPGVAVVPVALPAFLLGQPGGRRRDRGPGRRVGHQLQGDGRTADHLAPPAGVARAAQPAAPEPRGVVRQLLGFLGRDPARRAAHDSSTTPPVSPSRRVRVQRSPSPARSGVIPDSAREDPSGAMPCMVSCRPSEANTPPCSESLQRVRLAAVVEARLDLDREPHDAADHADVRTSRCRRSPRPR